MPRRPSTPRSPASIQERIAHAASDLTPAHRRVADFVLAHSFRAATMAIEAVDLALARILPVIDAMGGVALITADHGNADEMFELDKKTKQPAQNKDGSFKAKTAHTLNPVPLILYDNVTGGKLGLKQTPEAGLSNIAATTANLLGFEKHAKWDESLLEVK